MTNSPHLTYIPSSLTNRPILVYLLALLTVSLLFRARILAFEWWLFGIAEVTIFFYFSNILSLRWQRLMPQRFIKQLFLYAFLVRLLWVVVTYIFNVTVLGDPFGYDAADATFYQEMGAGGAQWLRDGNWNLFDYLRMAAGYGTNQRHSVAFSDIGYPLYLAVVYFFTNDSIFIARVLNCVWGAWTAVLIYKLAARNFGEMTGRMAGILCMLMPTLWYYAGTQLKETFMVFMTVLVVEQGDSILRGGKLVAGKMLLVVAVTFYLFMYRTVLAATLIIAFFMALTLSSQRVVKWGQRVIVGFLAVLLAGIMIFQNTNISSDVRSVTETGSSGQKSNMEWRSNRANGNSFAKYAGATVFAPLIFTLPFPTIVETPGQEIMKMQNGGNFCKNIISFFTILAMFMLLFEREWRKHLFPLAFMLGYLLVLVLSTFAQAGRFHQPSVPFEMMFASYAIAKLPEKIQYKRWYDYWLVIMYVAAVAWSWFKLAGRGLI